jgi:hypothetical protein
MASLASFFAAARFLSLRAGRLHGICRPMSGNKTGGDGCLITRLRPLRTPLDSICRRNGEAKKFSLHQLPPLPRERQIEPDNLEATIGSPIPPRGGWMQDLTVDTHTIELQ